MATPDLVPSWLTTWVAWRNLYTTPNAAPFSLLKKELGLDRMPSSAEYLKAHNNDCPYCHGDAVVNSPTFGMVYCLCKLLEKVQKLDTTHKLIRTKTTPATLEQVVYPVIMGGEYHRDMKKAVEVAQAFIKSPDNWILLSGKSGTGKTHILRSINTAFEPIALYLSCGKLEQLIHQFRKDDLLDEFYDILVNAPILILDDIGIEYGGMLVKSMTEKIIDARYEMFPSNPLVIATNLPPSELQSYIPRASDRIFDRTRTIPLTITRMKSIREVHPGMRV